MNFHEYLLLVEERKQEMTIEQCAEFYLDHCTDTDLKNPLVRGSNSEINLYVNNTKYIDTERKSRSGRVFSMVIIDKIMQDQFGKSVPLREKSLIMGTYKNISHARQFGEKMFYCFPVNDANIAYIKQNDFNYNRTINDNNSILKSIFKTNEKMSYEEIIEQLEHDYETVDNFLKKIEMSHKYNAKTFDSLLKQMYDLNELDINICKPKDIPNEKIEVWTHDKCLLIQSNLYQNFLDQIHSIKNYRDGK